MRFFDVSDLDEQLRKSVVCDICGIAVLWNLGVLSLPAENADALNQQCWSQFNSNSQKCTLGSVPCMNQISNNFLQRYERALIQLLSSILFYSYSHRVGQEAHLAQIPSWKQPLQREALSSLWLQPTAFTTQYAVSSMLSLYIKDLLIFRLSLSACLIIANGCCCMTIRLVSQ